MPAVDADALSSLVEREQRIERAQRNAYLEIGLDLKAIRDGGLYKVARVEAVAGRYSFTTFEEYVETRWDMADRSARQMIESAEAAEKIGTIVPVLPSRESHVRELLKIEDDGDRATVWQSVVNLGETVTAKIVQEQVALFIAQQKKSWLTIDEWNELDESDREKLFDFKSDQKFNKQENDSIEWAQWSWNPITGCKHDCPYCYARDIANRFFPQKFEASIYPGRFSAPQNTKVPDAAASDTAFKNVFTGSMADVFGRWVPEEWIRRVLSSAEQAEDWNFLFLTKFPQRIHEFGELPKNAWMGTTVDCQDRVANAEKAFAKMGGGIKWLSIEPMLTPIKFKKLDSFDWVVIGGSSPSTATPKWVPHYEWLHDLHQQARDAGCAIYHKTNLGLDNDMRIKEFPWEEAKPVKTLPESLQYLGMKGNQ